MQFETVVEVLLLPLANAEILSLPLLGLRNQAIDGWQLLVTPLPRLDG